jgi:hypothetical protein
MRRSLSPALQEGVASATRRVRALLRPEFLPAWCACGARVVSPPSLSPHTGREDDFEDTGSGATITAEAVSTCLPLQYQAGWQTVEDLI